MPTEFSHVGIVMAIAAKRPLLVLREKSVAERGSLRKVMYVDSLTFRTR
jgi:hypothetical protein